LVLEEGCSFLRITLTTRKKKKKLAEEKKQMPPLFRVRNLGGWGGGLNHYGKGANWEKSNFCLTTARKKRIDNWLQKAIE